MRGAARRTRVHTAVSRADAVYRAQTLLLDELLDARLLQHVARHARARAAAMQVAKVAVHVAAVRREPDAVAPHPIAEARVARGGVAAAATITAAANVATTT